MSARGPILILILSIDGGGSRGVISVNMLKLMEHEGKIPNRGTLELFAGVSAGAMVVVLIVKNAGSMQLLAEDSYSSDNRFAIFNKSVWEKMLGRIQNQPTHDGVDKRSYIEKILAGVSINHVKHKTA